MDTNRKNIFETNAAKASNKLTINSFMMGSLLFIFTLIWTLSPDRFDLNLISQITLAFPLLFVSSLAYSKIAYWHETKLWDTFGWFTNNLANILILNSIGLMVASINKTLSISYFSLLLIAMFIYSVINVIYTPSALSEKIFKYLFLVTGIILGGVLMIL
ncbi:MAG: hypothetical protein WC631_03325 [Candidatus Paceibacterota bacterium]|jgi:hypothetical protein